MELLQALLFICLGAYCVIKGADYLTRGSVMLAERMGVSQIVIGLTIVAIGTSLPEFCVSVLSALTGQTDMAVGNVMGSNIFNTLLIVGCAALIVPISVQRNTVRRDMPCALLASVLLCVFARDGQMNRWESFLLIASGIAYIAYTVLDARGKQQNSASDSANQQSGNSVQETQDATPDGQASNRSLILFLVLGLALLPVGSTLFVDGAKDLAIMLGMSEAVVGLTIVAGGTSLPELATTIVAARKGNAGIAIGNVLGSNLMNILLILGLTGIITPMRIDGISPIDYSMLIISMALFLIFSWTKLKIERWEGGLLTAVYLLYLSYLIIDVVK